MTADGRPPTAVHSILVVRLDRVGDMVLSGPFLRNLRRHFAGSKITAVVTPYNADVLEGNPDVDERLVVDPGQGPGGWLRLAADLRRRQFDVAVPLSPTMKSYGLAWASGARVRAGIVYSRRFAARLLARWLLTHPIVIGVEEALERGWPVPHEVRQLLQVGTALGIACEEVPLRLYVPPAVVEEARRALPAGPLLIGIHLSPKWLAGGWGIEDFILMVHHVLEAHAGAHVVLTYGVLERPMAESLQRYLEGRVLDPDRVRLDGDHPFARWAAAVAACSLFVSPDTGALHVASALQVPVVAVYEGSTYAHCSQQWEPWMVPHEKVKKTTVADTVQDILLALQTLRDRKPVATIVTESGQPGRSAFSSQLSAGETEK